MKICWRDQLLSIIFLFALVCTTLAAGPSTPAAVLHANGKVQVNGTESRKTTTLFSGDLIQTDANSVANIIAGGSSVLVMPNGSVKFLGNAVEVDQGDIAIATSSGMTAEVDGLTITPAGKKQSRFEVADTEDSVLIAARQGNVAVSDGQQTSTTEEGQETTHKKKKKEGGAVPAASGTHGISGKTLWLTAGALGATAAGLAIVQSDNGSKKCVSPSGGKNCCTQNQQGNNNCQ
jgi:hypothetical protein